MNNEDDTSDTTDGASPAATTAPKIWQKGGPTPNKLGRKKGTPNYFSQALLRDFTADWRENGAAAIAKLRKENVAAYVKTAVSLCPRELLLQISRPMEQLSDLELQQAALQEHQQTTLLLEHVRTIGGEALLEQAQRELGDDTDDDGD